MSITKEDVLVQSLKHVSLQRLRTIKMDMDKMARDSRISNDRSFWSLLEFHNIRLDERTKREFYKQVADSRGVNVESAIKNLRHAQRKTGRDSVEVLPKHDSPVPLKEPIKTPQATAISIEMPKIPASTRNYKLDKFRNKALNIGKLRAALKKNAPLKALRTDDNPEPVQSSEGKTEDIQKTASENKTSQPALHLSQEREIKDKASGNADTAKTSSVTNETKGLKGEKVGGSSTKSDGSISKPESFLKLLLKEKEVEDINSNTSKLPEASTNEANDVKGCITEPAKENLDNSLRKKENSLEATTQTNKAKSSKLVLANETKTKINHEKGVAEDDNEKDSTKIESKEKTEETEKSALDTESTSMQDVKTESKCDTPEKTEIDTKHDKTTLKNSQIGEQQNIHVSSKPTVIEKNEEKLIPPSQLNNSDKPDLKEKQETETNITKTNVASSEESVEKESDISATASNTLIENVTTSEQNEKRDDVVDGNNQKKTTEETNNKYDTKNATEDQNALLDNNANANNVDDSVSIDARPIHDEKSTIAIDNVSIDKEPLNKDLDEQKSPNKHTGSDLAIPDEAQKSAEMENNVDIMQMETKPVSAEDGEKSKRVGEKKEQIEKKRKHKKKSKLISELHSKKKEGLSNEDTANSSQSSKQDSFKTQPAESTLQPNSDDIEQKTIEVNIEFKGIETAICDTKRLVTDNNFDSNSLSSMSSEEDSLSLDDIIRDISLQPGEKEKRSFGDVTVELSAPEWFQNRITGKEKTHLAQLEIDWVYGCNTVQSQCMACSRQGELLYYAGCIIVLYNRIRRSQRHYLEHTSAISGLATHPSDDLAASAQEEVTFSSPTGSSLPCDGRYHVRVWDTVTLETKWTIGAGTLRNSVYKMQFLNYAVITNYFVTIEHNEESTLTVWDGGCRITSKPTAFSEPQKHEKPSPNKSTSTRKRFTPTLPKSHNPSTHTSKLKSSRPRTTQVTQQRPINGPKGIAGNLTGELEFATVGKHHLSFWMLEEKEENGLTTEGLEISGPEHGDFGKTFFRAEYVSTCLATNQFLDGSVITGDSNGTLLIWSEATKLAARGYPHAHECSISAICISEEGYIFTAGVKDRLVKAFNVRKNKVTKCGSIKIPPDLGSATCLTFIENTLFVATDKNLIIAIVVETLQTLGNAVASLPVAPLTMTDISPRTSSPQKTSSHSQVATTPRDLDVDKPSDLGVFTKWENHEIARGFAKGIKNACALEHLKIRNRSGKEPYQHQSHKLVSMPSLEEGISILNREMARSAGVRKDLNDRSSRTSPQNSRVYAWNENNTNRDEFNPRRPTPSVSSPRLRTKERVWLKEKARIEDLQRSMPLFATTNHVTTHRVFDHEGTTTSYADECFVVSTSDGWLEIYSSQEYKMVGRCKLPPLGKVMNIDVCSRRNLVATGSDTGHVALVRIDQNKFEVLSDLKCRCSGGGAPAINAIKFSPSGRKLAVSIGYDIIILKNRKYALSEHGRCIGHQSSFISSIDWSERKYSGTHFLRSCSRKPVPELKTWHADTMLELQDVASKVRWASHTCILDYCTKGIWDYFSNPYDVSCIAVTTGQNSKPVDKKRTMKHRNLKLGQGLKEASTGDEETSLFIGDAAGSVSVQPYPCVKWNSSHQQACRAHFTTIKSISVLTKGNHLVSTSEDGSAIVQWSIS